MTEVVVVRWPEEGSDGARLAEDGVAVLYLVEADADPPMPTSCLEDWVRLPGDDRDVSARVAALELRAATHDAPPWVDEHGRLHYRGQLLALSPSEARLAEVLAEHFGDVVSDRALNAITLENGDSGPQPALRVQMSQLRSRIRDSGLLVHRIRRRGYRLEHR